MISKLQESINQYRHIQKALTKINKHRVQVTLSADEKEVIDEVKQIGFAIISDYYSKERCNQMIKEIDYLFDTYPKYTWKDDFDADCRIYGADRLSSLIKEYHADAHLNKMANAFNQTPTTNFHTLIGRITAAPHNLGSGQGWHRDTAKPYQFKSILYLTDVNEENGPFEYLTGTNNYSSLYKCIWSANMKSNQSRFTHEEVNRLLELSKYQKRTFTARAGTLILVNTFGIHRGSPIKEGIRYALTNYYFNDYQINIPFLEKKFNIPSI
ncbi:MAG: phytanoyl-CoA dioxygenase family protein [Saprospiraceae bacterium]|nr:phytanoyl-CoA dioxygenase family protein [Saprospiraceae bacterium]